MMDPLASPAPLPRPGQILARGVCRALVDLGFAPLTEHVPAPGLRVDVMALGPKGEIWVVECKSSRVDFTSDRKWQGYLDWCDRYFWAVDQAFPVDLLPEGTGLIMADAWGGEVLRLPPEHRLAGARRVAVTRGFARAAARALLGFRDPGPGPVRSPDPA
ncbi:MmcB family DNA repair protein [Gemmobacter sp.]|uniref:MmcB family DNA repair protein n=1 Tax=Gemmobacter sp. TaxID=1898957 RepID=UPI003A598BA7